LFHDAGIAVSVNPDDRAITTTTVADEYRLWRHLHGFTDGEFRLINMQALEAAFADETTKAGLRPVLASGWG
jgi:adenosine deaminase